MAPAGARRRAPEKNSGPVDALLLVPCRTEPVLKIRAVGLTVVNGKWSCDYTDQGMAARLRALERGTEAHAHPSRAIRAHTAATNEDIFSTQYAVRNVTQQ